MSSFTGLKTFLQSWEGLCTAIAGAVASTIGLFHLLPRIYRVAMSFYEGALFTIEIRDKLAAVEARIVDRLNSLDDGQLNMIVVRRQMLDNDADVAYFETSPQGKTDWVSKTWTRWTGIENDDARGNGWENGIAPEDLARVLHNWQLAIDHQRDYVDRYSYFDRNGKRTQVETIARPIRRKDGTILNYFGSARVTTTN
jgi:PAS domain S-box-containing protein